MTNELSNFNPKMETRKFVPRFPNDLEKFTLFYLFTFYLVC